AGPGPAQGGDGGGDGGLDARQVVGADALGERPPELELREVEVHHERRDVGELRLDPEVGVPQRQQRGAELAAGIVEGVDVEGGGQVDVAVGLEAPRGGGAKRQAGLAHGQVLEVAAVTPVGVEQAGAAVGQGGVD